MSNEFADGFQAEPPLVAPSIPVPDDDTVDDDPRDIYNSIVMSGQPDTPLRSTQLDPGDLMPRGEDPLLPDSPPSLPSIPDLPPGQLAMFSHLPPPSPPEAEDVSIAGPEADLGDLTGEQKGFDTPIDAFGRYEAFLARVRSVHYLKTNGHPVARMKQAVDYERVAVWYDTNNEPSVGAVGPTHSRPIPAVGYATPFPVGHDQEAYHVKRGDIVTIIQGEDRAYYMIDDQPFLAQVVSHVETDYSVIARQDAPPTTAFETDHYLVGATGSGAWSGQDNKIARYGAGAWSFLATSAGDQVYAETTDNFWLKAGGTWGTTTDVKEQNNGGAGYMSLRVRRKSLDDNPTTPLGSITDHDDLQTAAAADVEYEKVQVLSNGGEHTYRVGDLVWVFRRGYYFFCLPAPDMFVGEVQVSATPGPEGEADFATNHYWVKEVGPAITYTNNAWVLDQWGAQTQTDPTGSGGRYGRWVDVLNLAEASTSHLLQNGDIVTVHKSVEALLPAGTGGVAYTMERATNGVFVGAILLSGGTAVPVGYLECDGSEVSQATYAALFSVIGTNFNTGGEAGGNFRLPGEDGNYLKGTNGTPGTYSGAATHTHDAHGGTEAATATGAVFAFTSDPDPLSHSTENHEPPNFTVRYMIKY
ncbi:MAG TPA: tail fiber protein [Phycisphaerae bacterium]|nr:tail fiber protein [Phycisphaerae bacterium]